MKDLSPPKTLSVRNEMDRFAGWLYNALLRLYPRDFRGEFGDEMRSVFQETLHGRSGFGLLRQFGREIRDLPVSLIEIYSTTWFPGGSERMKTNIVTPSTRQQALIGILPFIAFGLVSMIYQNDWAGRSSRSYVEFAVYLLVLLGLLIGWRREFPLWSYSYLGWSLTLALVTSNPWMRGAAQGYRNLIPLGVTALLALAWTRSLEPLRILMRDILEDWTRLSLTMFTLGAWVLLIYDENHHPLLPAFMLASLLVTAVAAWIFLRSTTREMRSLALFLGFAIGLLVDRISYATWDWRAYYALPVTPSAWYMDLWTYLLPVLLWSLIIFWPAVIGLIRYAILRVANRS